MPNFIYDTPSNPSQIPVMQGSITVDPNLPGYISPLAVDLLQNKPVLPPLDYTNLDFSSIKLQLLNLLKANSSLYGYNLRDFSDTNTAGMLLNITAYMGQMISYHADSMVNELFLDTAQSSWSTFRLLNLFGYKPTRPQPGVILLAVVRTGSTNSDPTQQALEDSSEILFSGSTSRQRMTLGSELYEIFPTKMLNGNLVPDLMGDFIIPPFVNPSTPDSVDFDLLLIEQNLYYCFGLTGVTVTENFVSSGQASQNIQLTQSPVLTSQVIVQVQDTAASTIPGQTIYNVWNELSYLSLAGFRPATRVGTTLDNQTPYLVSSFLLSPTAYAMKQQNQLSVGMIMELDYNNNLSIANYTDFISLLVPYMTGVLVNITSQKYASDQYVDVLLYHPNYIYGAAANTVASYGIQPTLVSYVLDENSNQVFWNPGDILYLLGTKQITINGVVQLYNGQPLYQPQIISDTQLQQANLLLYSDINYLNNNPNQKIAIGKALSTTTMAFGISSDYDTYIQSDTVYEVSSDGNFNCTVRFGDGTYGQIPPAGANIKVMYRTDDSNTTSNLVASGQANQIINVGTVALYLRNDYPSAVPTTGESATTAKSLVTGFFSAQDRAVIGADYTILTKKYNSDIKVTTALSKADADGSVVRLYTLVRRVTSTLEQLQPLSFIEKLQLSEYLNNYKCLGASIEIVDGLIRSLDLRIDLKIKPGYLAGQVKADVTSMITAYFSLQSTEMGIGFNAADFHNKMSNISGISDYDAYFGGIETITQSNGLVTPLGNYIFQQIKDIPSFSEANTTFPDTGNNVVGINNITKPMNAFELLSLATVEINTASR